MTLARRLVETVRGGTRAGGYLPYPPSAVKQLVAKSRSPLAPGTTVVKCGATQ